MFTSVSSWTATTSLNFFVWSTGKSKLLKSRRHLRSKKGCWGPPAALRWPKINFRKNF